MSILNFSDEELIEAIKEGNSLRSICETLNLSGTQYQYKKLRSVITNYDIDVSHHRTVSPVAYHRWLEKLENIDQNFLNKCDCWKDIPVKLKLHDKDKDLKSRYYTFLKDFVDNKKLDVSHFTFSKGGHPGKRYIEEEIFCENSNVNKKTLKKRYLKYRESLDIPYECDIIDCNLSQWHDKVLNLQLDHVNGINNDNRIENLRLLCPNCHSQTDTFAGKSKI